MRTVITGAQISLIQEEKIKSKSHFEPLTHSWNYEITHTHAHTVENLHICSIPSLSFNFLS